MSAKGRPEPVSSDHGGKHGTQHYSAALATSPRGAAIDLTARGLDDRRLSTFLRSVNDGNRLFSLKLGGNRLTDVGAHTLYKAFRQYRWLERLVVVNNRIGEDGGEALVALARENKRLVHLSVSGNELTDRQVALIRAFLLLNHEKIPQFKDTVAELDDQQLLEASSNASSLVSALGIANIVEVRALAAEDDPTASESGSDERSPSAAESKGKGSSQSKPGASSHGTTTSKHKKKRNAALDQVAALFHDDGAASAYVDERGTYSDDARSFPGSFRVIPAASPIIVRITMQRPEEWREEQRTSKEILSAEQRVACELAYFIEHCEPVSAAITAEDAAGPSSPVARAYAAGTLRNQDTGKQLEQICEAVPFLELVSVRDSEQFVVYTGPLRNGGEDAPAGTPRQDSASKADAMSLSPHGLALYATALCAAKGGSCTARDIDRALRRTHGHTYEELFSGSLQYLALDRALLHVAGEYPVYLSCEEQHGEVVVFVESSSPDDDGDDFNAASRGAPQLNSRSVEDTSMSGTEHVQWRTSGGNVLVPGSDYGVLFDDGWEPVYTEDRPKESTTISSDRDAEQWGIDLSQLFALVGDDVMSAINRSLRELGASMMDVTDIIVSSAQPPVVRLRNGGRITADGSSWDARRVPYAIMTFLARSIRAYLESSADNTAPSMHEVDRIFGSDGCTVVPRTVHRITRSCDAEGATSVAIRVGRWVPGVLPLVYDVVYRIASTPERYPGEGALCLVLGRPSCGRSTLLRAASHFLSTAAPQPLTIVALDTNGELCGGSWRPHPSVGDAIPIHVESHVSLAQSMRNTVASVAADVVVVDDVATVEQAEALRSVADQGVAVIAGVRCGRLSSLLHNPAFAPLHARSVRDSAIEILANDVVRIHHVLSRSARVHPEAAPAPSVPIVEERQWRHGLLYATLVEQDAAAPRRSYA